MDAMRRALIACCGAVLIVGCSDPKKPSNANFAKAIDAYLDKHPLCLEPPTGDSEPAGADTHRAFPAFLATTTDPMRRSTFDRDAKPFEALVKAGLLTAKPASITTGTIVGKDIKLAVREYDLTDAGRKAVRKTAPSRFAGDEICYGTAAVKEVTQFTEPASAFGMTMSSVNYTYQVKDRAPWSSDPAVVDAFPDLRDTAGDALQGRTDVVLTNNGWVDSRGQRM